MEGYINLEDARTRVRSFFIAARLTRLRYLPCVVVAINLAVHIGINVLGPHTVDHGSHPLTLSLAGAKINELVWAGEWWRLISSVFLHVDAGHVTINSLAAFILIQLSDNVFGTAWVIALYILSGVAGSLSSLLLSPNPSTGGSGAIFGLLGALTMFAICRRHQIPRRFRRAVFIITITIIFFSLIYGAFSEKVDHAAHAGGLIAGLLFGFKKRLPIFITGPVKPSWPEVSAAVISISLAGWAATQSWRNLAGQLDMPIPTFTDLEIQDVYIPCPNWKKGVADLSSTGVITCSETGLGSSLCFKDPYGTLFLVGKSGDLVPGQVFDPMMTLEYGLRVPRRVTHKDIAHYEILINREVAVILVGYDIILDRYLPMLDKVISGVRFRARVNHVQFHDT